MFTPRHGLKVNPDTGALEVITEVKDEISGLLDLGDNEKEVIEEVADEDERSLG